MSYILEALKKAEAERRQEKAPGIHSQPLPAHPPRDRGTPWQRPAAGVAAAIAMAALVAIAWFKPWQSPPVALRAGQPATPAATAGAPVPAASIPPAMQEPPDNAVKPQPAAIAEESSKTVPRREAKARQKERPAAVSSSAALAVAEAPVPTLRQLPEQIRRDIPELKVGGYIYADKADDRSVIVNNRLLHEGEEAAPGVTLERMQQHGMILRYKEFRFRTSY